MEHEQIVAKLSELDNRQKVSEHRIADLEDKNDKLETLTLSVQKIGIACETIAKEQQRMAEEQKEAKAKQNELAKKIIEVQQAPMKQKAKMHDDIVGWIIHSLVMALIGGILVYLGFQ